MLNALLILFLASHGDCDDACFDIGVHCLSLFSCIVFECSSPWTLDANSRVASMFHSCLEEAGFPVAIREEDHQVKCFGRNGHCTLNVPADLGPVSHIEAGENVYCAIKETGDLDCWGNYSGGQLRPPEH